jgi:hypothetical protein
MDMTQIPTRDALKAQAKRLRADMTGKGSEMTHAAALETVAHQWGMRDWNTLAARADVQAVQWQVGQRVSGRYLGQPFTGIIKGVSQRPEGFWSLTLRFDNAVDVVESLHFTNLHQQVSMTVNAAGETAQKTSNGQPLLVVGPVVP